MRYHMDMLHGTSGKEDADTESTLYAFSFVFLINKTLFIWIVA